MTTLRLKTLEQCPAFESTQVPRAVAAILLTYGALPPRKFLRWKSPVDLFNILYQACPNVELLEVDKSMKEIAKTRI